MSSVVPTAPSWRRTSRAGGQEPGAVSVTSFRRYLATAPLVRRAPARASAPSRSPVRASRRVSHVAHRYLPLAAQGGQHRGRDLRERGPGGDHGEADDQLAHAHGRGDGDRTVHEPARAQDEHAEPHDDEHDLQRHAPPPALVSVLLFVGGGDLRALPATLPDGEDRVGDHPAEQDEPVQAAEPAVQRQHQQQHGDPDHQRHVEPHQPPGDHQRGDERREPEDKEHVEDVAPHDVAHGDVGLTAKRRAHADRRLRRAGAERHHGEPHDQRRDAQRRGQPRGAAHQELRPGYQQGRPQSEQYQRGDLQLLPPSSRLTWGRNQRAQAAGACPMPGVWHPRMAQI